MKRGRMNLNGMIENNEWIDEENSLRRLQINFGKG